MSTYDFGVRVRIYEGYVLTYASYNVAVNFEPVKGKTLLKVERGRFLLTI